MINDHLHNKIEDYLSGNLAVEEVHSFENEIHTNAELKSAVEAYKLANELIIDNQLLNIKNKLQNIHNSSKTKNKSRNYILWLPLLFLFICLSIYFFHNNEKKKTTLTEKNKSEKPVNYSKPNIIDKKSETSSIKTKESYEVSQNNLPVEERNTTPVESDTLPTYKINDISANKTTTNDTINNSTKSNNNNTGIEKHNSTKNQKSEEEKLKEEKCAGLAKITPSVIITKPCFGEANGSLVFRNNSEDNLYSIDGGKTYQTSPEFYNLKSIKHQLYIKSKIYGCVSNTHSGGSNINACDYIIYPSQNKYLEIDFISDYSYPSYLLKIYDARNGNEIYTETITEGQRFTWEGNDNNLKDLPMGNYVYSISNKNEILAQGNITIVR